MDEKETNDTTTKKKTTKKDDRYGNIQIPTSTKGMGGVGSGDGTQGKSNTCPLDPLINIGCRYPNGITLVVNNKKVFLNGVNNMPFHKQKIGIGYKKLHQSIWEKIVEEGKYSHLIENGYIFYEK